MANPSSSSIDVIQQISDDASLLHRFCHGGDSESVKLGGVDTPTVHSFLSQWVQFLHSVVIAGEAFTPLLESGYYNTNSGEASGASQTQWLRTSNYCPVFANRIYAVDFGDLTSVSGQTPTRIDVHFYDKDKNWLSSHNRYIFFKAPDNACYVRLCFYFSADVAAGENPAVIVKDVVAGTRSASGANGKRVLALDWKDGFLRYDDEQLDVGNSGTSGYYKYALAFVSKGDLVWLKAGQSSSSSIIACIDSTGAVSHKVSNTGTRDNWLDHMWIADQDTCVILSNNTYYINSPECIIYPNFLYNDDTFNDADFSKPGYISIASDNTTAGFCSTYTPTYDSSYSGYASSQMICLKKGQHISIAAAVSPSAYGLAVYDETNKIVTSKSALGISSNGVLFYGYRCTDEYCFVRFCGTINATSGVDGTSTFLQYTTFNDVELSGKSLAMIGDSYVGPTTETSYSRAAFNLGMDYTSYGINGNSISAVQDNGMCIRYTQMASGFDYVGLVGGRNDYNASVPIGALDSTDASTFCGALNVLCEGLIKKYIGKKLFAVTSWNVNDGQNAYNDAFVAVVSGRWNIPVLQTYRGANVYMKVAEFRQAYCIADNDVSHLNVLGHMNIMSPMIEAFLKTL